VEPLIIRRGVWVEAGSPPSLPPERIFGRRAEGGVGRGGGAQPPNTGKGSKHTRLPYMIAVYTRV